MTLVSLSRSAVTGSSAGGKNIYGVPVGILVLESQFPRIPGDVGNADTWPFPVQFRVVDDATPDAVVRHLKQGKFLESFVRAARGLERQGVSLVTTGCGFLVLLQHDLQANLSIPVLTSSLLQVPWVLGSLPAGRSVAVLTVERASLTRQHLQAAGISDDMPVVIEGLDSVEGYFTGQILGDRIDLDVDRARAEHVQVATEVLERHPEVGAFVLECTNMPPYAADICEATGLPVYDLTTMVGWAVASVRRRGFVGSL